MLAKIVNDDIKASVAEARNVLEVVRYAVSMEPDGVVTPGNVTRRLARAFFIHAGYELHTLDAADSDKVKTRCMALIEELYQFALTAEKAMISAALSAGVDSTQTKQ